MTVYHCCLQWSRLERCLLPLRPGRGSEGGRFGDYLPGMRVKLTYKVLIRDLEFTN